MPFKKNNPGCPCCEFICPDCDAPLPVSTGSTDPETAWYLIPVDAYSTPYLDRATSYFVKRTSPLEFVDFSETQPIRAWRKFRCYFADTCYAELYGIYYSISPTTYNYDWYLKVVAGDQTINVPHTSFGSNTATPTSLGIAITHDEATAIARIVAGVTTNGTNGCQLYARVDLSGNDYYGGGHFGIRYGWGYGAYDGTGFSEPGTITETAYRHVNYCQSFPHIAPNITTSKHGWLKTAHLAVESITAEIEDVPCDDANGAFTLGHPPTAMWGNSYSSAFTLDMAPRHGKDRYGQLLGNYIPTGWMTPAGSPLGAGREWVICPELETIKGGINRVRFGLRARTRKAPIFPSFIYPEGYEYLDYGLIAYSDVVFEGVCDQYNGADAIDGLVFDDWTVASGNGLPETLDEMTVEISV